MNTNISKIVDEWSYRLSLIEGHDGLPDIESYSDLTVLKSVLTDYKWPVEITYELLYNMEHPLGLLGEAKVTLIKGKELQKKIRDVGATVGGIATQTLVSSWVVKTADDVSLFNQVAKAITSDPNLKPYIKKVKLVKEGHPNYRTQAQNGVDFAEKTPWYSGGVGASNSFMFLAVQVKNTTTPANDNKWFHYKFSVSGGSGGGGGAPSQAARYEEGIVLWHNTWTQHKGVHNDALAKASAYGISNMKTYNNYAAHMQKAFGTSKTGKINGVGKLKHSGADSFSIQANKDAGYINKTAKSDIYDDSGNDISVKKEGGSQLMSGKKGDSMGVFYGALRHYFDQKDHNSPAKSTNARLLTEIEDLIDDFGKQFDTVIGSSGAGDVKERFGRWYVKERLADTTFQTAVKDIVTKIKNVKKPSKDDKDVHERITGKRTIGKGSNNWGMERHAKYEAMEAGMIDKGSSKWKDWAIPGVTKQGTTMQAHLTKYLGTLSPNMADEAKKVIDLNQVHIALEKRVIAALNDKEFLQYVVYEAGTGWYKFEGDQNHNMSPVKGTSHGSANKLLYFTADGVTKTLEDLDKSWAKGKIKDLKINLGFKSSGRSKSTALRLLQNHLEKDGNLLMESEQNFGTLFEYDVNKILNGEMKVLHEEINHCNEMLNEIYLMEGFFSNVGKKLKAGAKYLKRMAKKILKKLEDAVKKFWKNLKDKVVGKLKEYLKAGFDFFMDALGAEVSPTGDSIVLKA